ncbi:metal ABC transporter ATP-binding protein [Anaerococcus sp. ENR1011]|uniref:Metal ABC transporter ATP-binding protein n=1 Tax=Anaerococcus groningensis TaxID=3115616 RepID=A0ABW9N1M5_9FIRM
MNVIEIKNLNFGYNEKLILKDINLEVEKGDFLAISGQNGSGKTTLIKILTRELKKQDGEINILGKAIENIDDFSDIGYVPQLSESRDITFPLTCFEYVILNLYREFNAFKRPSKETIRKTNDIFKRLDIESLKDRPFNKLSGGQQQRVMIARSMVASPKILILDEPTVGIDQKSKEEFLDLLGHLNKRQDITILIISHEMDLIDKFVNKTRVLKEGRLINA